VHLVGAKAQFVIGAELVFVQVNRCCWD
jgi:hypothetical protein